MNTAELKKRISEVLGVSSTQSDIAYEIFIEKLTQALSLGITLKIPRIGFFQIKENQKSKSLSQILFAALPEDYSIDSKNFYLTLDIQNKSKNNYEIDSQVFSIGVGKPLLPLANDDTIRDSEISFEILKKSIEERAKELLAEADQIPNYNIWEEFIYDDKDENLFDHQDNIENDNTNNIVFENKNNLLDQLLSQNDFTIENDFNEEETQIEALNQKIEDEINNIDLSIPDDLSVNSLLEENIEIKENEKLKNDLLDDSIINNDQNELGDTQSKLNEISTFAEELKSQIEELEKIGNEIINEKEVSEESTIEKDELKTNSVEDLSSLIKIEEKQLENYDQDYAFDDNSTKSELKKESEEEITLSTLLNEELNVHDENTINVEPPASSKEFIIDDFSMFNNDIINIEENELKQIVDNEIINLEQNYNEENHSEILNKLLTEEQIKKIETKEEIAEDETEISLVEESASNKIEWNWGDELREEFGIGNLENIEIDKIQDPNDDNIYEVNSLEDELPKNYEDSPTIELRKTRVDLFTKLEETLEREINFLKQEVELKNEEVVFEKPEVAENINDNRIDFEEVNESSANNIDFKDEKVILDFKTPPPQYEFIEEKPVEENIVNKLENEPLLKPPKKITIILSPEEQENLIEKKTITKTLENSETEIEIVQQAKEKKNYWKLISIILSILIVITVSIYFALNYFNSKTIPNDSQTNVAQENITDNKNQNEIQRQNNQPQENTLQTTTNELLVDEYSDFPISATPPKPIKSGNEIDVQQLIPKTPKVETKTITPIETKNEKSKNVLDKNQIKEQKGQLENKNVSKGKSQNEIRLSNMIFYDGKNYSFQTSSWKNKSLAEVEVNRLRSLGFNAFLTEAFLPQKGGTWYRVRIGYFNSEQEALEFMKKNNF